MKKKLLIWDFDGVIADTEKLWMNNRLITLNENYGLNWDEHTIWQKLSGMSDQTKREVLNQMGIITDDAFWEKKQEA